VRHSGAAMSCHPCRAYAFIWRIASASIQSARLSFTFWSMPVTGRVDMERPVRERPCRPPLVMFLHPVKDRPEIVAAILEAPHIE